MIKKFFKKNNLNIQEYIDNPNEYINNMKDIKLKQELQIIKSVIENFCICFSN